MDDSVRARALQLAVQKHGSEAPTQTVIATAQQFASFLAPDDEKPIWTACTISDLLDVQDDPVAYLSKFSVQDLTVGLIPFKPYPFQEELIKFMAQNHCGVIRNARQMGVTTCMAMHALWRCLVRPDSSSAFIAPNFNMAKAFTARLYELWRSLPPHLRAELHSQTSHGMTFKNGSSIMVVSATSHSPLRGRSLSNLVIMDAAYISHRVSEDLLYSLFPICRNVIVQSSAGDTDGLFYDLWTRALDGRSTFPWLDLPWSLHPERDSAWAAATKASIGNDSFKREYEGMFIAR